MTKEYAVKDLKPGMVTAVPVRTRRGQLVVNQETSLSASLIARLEFYGIEKVQIKENDVHAEDKGTQVTEAGYTPAKNPAPVQSPVLDASYSQKVKKTDDFKRFQIEFTLRCNDLKNCFDAVLTSGNVNKEELLEKTTSLIRKQQTTIDIFDMLHNMRQVNDSTYAHSINVALISRIIGKWLRFSPEELDTLTLAGLLHDIGKTSIPNEVLNKDGRLTDEEFQLIRRHPKMGYDILKMQPLDSHVKKAALMHH